MYNYLENLFLFTSMVAPYMLGGLLIAGPIRSMLSLEFIKKQLGNNGVVPVLKAAMIGVPLPLCSCSVIPTAITLKKAGASNGATSSFLISTPESGVDSIAMTYALMDLPMTIIRPIAAFASAIVAGLLQNIFNKKEYELALSGSGKSCCHQKKSCCDDENSIKKESFVKKIIDGIKYAYTDLFDDIALWVLIGLLVGALIQTVVPESMLTSISGPYSRMLLLLIGIPIYVCASSTTPMAVSMILKGMSPGTALILLLVGPATNISNMLVLQKYIGKKGVIINVLSIAVVALLASYLVDYCYLTFGWSVSSFKIMGNIDHHSGVSLFNTVCIAIFSVMILKGIWKSFIKKKS